MQSSFFRRLFQFRLRTLLLLVVAVAAYLGWWKNYDYYFPPQTPLAWNPGQFSRRTPFTNGVPPQSKNVKWCSALGSQTMSSPVVSGGKVFIGTNNAHGYLPRYPNTVDLGVLLCFDADDGKFLWQASSGKLPTGRVEDWPLFGVTATPLVVEDRLYYVNNRAEVVCLDTTGFYDHENDGPVQDEFPGAHEADVIWSLDMRAKLGVHPHNFSFCRPATDGQRLFVVTGNAVDESHLVIPNPDAPSFIALDRPTGKVLWTDNSPGANIAHTQWGSPTYAILGGVPQVIFPGGDGWLYSFDPAGTPEGQSKLLWKFDTNPKAAVLELGGRGTRNDGAFSIAVEGDRVYAATGQDPEHGEGEGILWCIDGTKRGDVSAELAVHRDQPTEPLPHRRIVAIDEAAGESAVPNPNSAVIWKFDKFDFDQSGTIDFEETLHRTRSGVVLKDGVLLIADFSGLVHCFDTRTGQRKLVYDCLAACWTSPYIVGRHAYIPDEDGDITIFELFAARRGDSPSTAPIAEIHSPSSIYAAPTSSRGVLFIANKNLLFAIEDED